jgi:hypothetical protein
MRLTSSMGPTYYLNEEILGFRLDEMSSTHYVNNTVKIRFIVSSKGPFLGMMAALFVFLLWCFHSITNSHINLPPMKKQFAPITM